MNAKTNKIMKKVYVIFQVIDNLRGIEFIISSRDEALAQMRVLRDEINSSRLFRSNGGCGFRHSCTHEIRNKKSYIDAFKCEIEGQDFELTFLLKEYDMDNFYKMILNK